MATATHYFGQRIWGARVDQLVIGAGAIVRSPAHLVGRPPPLVSHSEVLPKSFSVSSTVVVSRVGQAIGDIW